MFQTIPDFPAAMQDLLGSDVDGDDQFKAFLATLADENGSSVKILCATVQTCHCMFNLLIIHI